MTINNILNEANRLGGHETELEFQNLTKDANGNNRVSITQTKTSVISKFKFADEVEKSMKQKAVLDKISGFQNPESLKISVEIDDSKTNLHKSDCSVMSDIPNVENGKNKWDGVAILKEKDIVEIKQQSSGTAKVFYAESFKFATKAGMDYYKAKTPEIKKKFEDVIDTIIIELEKYRERQLKNPHWNFGEPKILAIGTGTSSPRKWKLIEMKPADFWGDMRFTKTEFGSVPRITIDFKEGNAAETNESVVESELNSFLNELQISSNTVGNPQEIMMVKSAITKGMKDQKNSVITLTVKMEFDVAVTKGIK